MPLFRGMLTGPSYFCICRAFEFRLVPNSHYKNGLGPHSVLAERQTNTSSGFNNQKHARVCAFLLGFYPLKIRYICSVRVNKAYCSTRLDKRKGAKQQFGWEKSLYLKKEGKKNNYKKRFFCRLSDSICLGNSSLSSM